MIVLWW
jgi:phospho-2-dehydro-3-deoxyheptonate aldolase